MKKTSAIRKICVLLLFAAYTFSVVPFTSFHFHEPACKGNTAAVENDPCHLAIYHHNEYPGTQCHHNHLSTPVKKCEWCKHLYHPTQHGLTSSMDSKNTALTIFCTTPFVFCFQFHAPYCCNKGPPSSFLMSC